MGMPLELKKYTGLLDIEKTSERLEAWHKQAIVLHLEGWTATEISNQLNKASSTVSKLLRSEKARNLINDYYNFLDSEYQSLYKLAVNAMRDAMRSSAPLELRVNTAKFFLQGKGKAYGGDGDQEESAEDMIKKVINIYVDQRGSEETSKDFNNKLMPPNEEEELK